MPGPLVSLLEFPVHETGLLAGPEIGERFDVLPQIVVKLGYPQVRVSPDGKVARAVRVAEEEERPVIGGGWRQIPVPIGFSGRVASVHRASLPACGTRARIG